MGGFAAILGHAATGFEQARQQDLQRQFVDEQNRRAMASDLLQKIALDPNQHPDVRNAATQGVFNIAQTPSGKKYNPMKDIGDVFNSMVQAHAQQAAAPQPTQTTTSFQAPGGPMLAPGQQSPTGGTGASRTIPSIGMPPLPPGISGPPQAPSAQASVPLSQSRVDLGTSAQFTPPPPPPQGLLAGVPEIASNAAQMAGAQAGGALAGQMAARQQVLAGSNVPEPMQTYAALGIPFAPLLRTTGAGAGFAGQLRAEGEPVPTTIPDGQWVNKREMAGGMVTYEAAAAPGQKAEGDQMLGPLTLERGKQQIDLPFYQQKVGMQLAKSLQLQSNAFDLAVQRGALGDANQIYMKNWGDLQQRTGALQLMEQNYKEALAGNQQAQVSLLFNHIGMTSGAVPGSRQSRATIEEAEHSTPWVQGIIAKWFHQDENGDYIYDGMKGGINLTKPQMQQMVDLAQNRVAIQRQVLQSMSQAPGFNGQAAPPGVSAIGGFGGATKGAKPSAQPPAPPASAPTGGTGSKVISAAAVLRAAQEHGVSVQEATRQAKAAGYTVQ